jgi:bifunctional dethiobiotin synthetase / adenosylmethionine---8-amino-7-oxononanoate aminotransferase
MLLRGYTIDSVLLFRESYYRNWEYITDYFARHHPDVYVQAFQEPPNRSTNPEEDNNLMEHYYSSVTASGEMKAVMQQLDARHTHRIEELESMPRRTLDTVWWPFVQHGLVKDEKDVTVIDSAHSDFFSVYNRDDSESSQRCLLQPHLDGSASWWTQVLGHAHPALTLAAARAAGRYGHVMFPQATHAPALRLAERLVHHGPGKGWASRAFFSDNGATGMEIALKMALRAFCMRNGIKSADVEAKQLGVLGLKGSYHGDTIGAMDACEEGVYTCEWHRAKGYWLDPPTVSIRDGKVVLDIPVSMSAKNPPLTDDDMSLSFVYDVARRLNTPLASFYRYYISQVLLELRKNPLVPKLAALVLEPLLMGAGGMIFVDPLFQRVMIDVVRSTDAVPPPSDSPRAPLSPQWAGLPVVFDEVFVGLYRIGLESTSSLLGVTPDISVHAKALTGGVLPLAATLATDEIFRAFYSERKEDALLHGHSYTAHAVGCEVANETLRIIDGLVASPALHRIQRRWATSPLGSGMGVWSFWDPMFVASVSHQKIVAEVMTLGTVLAIKFKDDQAGEASVHPFPPGSG